MNRVAAAALVIATLTGCTRTVDATPTAEPPPKLDCNLIFPGPGGA